MPYSGAEFKNSGDEASPLETLPNRNCVRNIFNFYLNTGQNYSSIYFK